MDVASHVADNNVVMSKFAIETFLAYLQRSTISSTDRLEPSLPMAKSAVTENIPKQTEFERTQHKVVIKQNESALSASGYTSSSQAPSVILIA